MKSISFAYLACTETEDFNKSLEIVYRKKRDIDEIVVLLDSDSYTKETKKIALEYTDNVFYNSLNRNFARQKNELILHCKCDYIFNLDADEYINEEDFNILYYLVDNKQYNYIDLFTLSRINIVNGITKQHIDNWHWQISKKKQYIEQNPLLLYNTEYIQLLKEYNCIIESNNEYIRNYIPIINYPDPQGRLWKNIPKIRWRGDVHERLSGYSTISNLPIDIIHIKDIKRQEIQNNFYETIRR